MNIGASFTQMESFLNSISIPSMSLRLYQKTHNFVCNAWGKVALESMNAAAKEEAELSVAAGSVSKDGVPMITVFADGSWAKRSYRGGGSYS